MRLGFVNGWNSRKQWDKVEVELRISMLTLLELRYDHSSKWFKLTICNWSINVVGG